MKTFLLSALIPVLLAAWSCSPAAPPTARGSAHYSIGSPANEFGECGYSSVGGIADGDAVPELPTGMTPPTDFGEEVLDGTPIEGSSGTYEVTCRITGENKHNIEVYMKGPNTSPQAGSSTGATNIEIIGTIGADGSGADATVIYRTTPAGVGSNVNTSPCRLAAIPDETNAGEFQIGDGDARFTFFCPETILARDQLGRCEVKGTISVRNCVTK